MKSRTFLVHFLRIISIIFLIIVALCAFKIYVWSPCRFQYKTHKIRENLRLPDNIRNIYYAGEIKIDDPLVALIDNEFYVFESETVNKYDGCDSLFIIRDDVIWLSLYNFSHRKYFDKRIDLHGSLEIHFEEYLIPCDTIQGLPLYRFPYKPKSFILSMVRKFKWKCVIEPDVWEIEYLNRDYIPSLCPRFSARDAKKIINEVYDNYFEKHPDEKLGWWENFLINLQGLLYELFKPSY